MKESQTEDRGGKDCASVEELGWEERGGEEREGRYKSAYKRAVPLPTQEEARRPAFNQLPFWLAPAFSVVVYGATMGRAPGIWILASGSVGAVGRKLWGVDSWLSFGVLFSFRPFLLSSSNRRDKG
jgi:hypothetical protein